MLLSQKAQYALRAIFELALRAGEGPIRIADIAEAQAIPVRFLEVILNQLKQAGFAESRRGSTGGYYLARAADSITVGDVVRFVHGPIAPVECLVGEPGENCALRGKCVFMPLWREVQKAVSTIYDGRTFQDLVDQEKARCRKGGLDYAI